MTPLRGHTSSSIGSIARCAYLTFLFFNIKQIKQNALFQNNQIKGINRFNGINSIGLKLTEKENKWM